ncbi:hypothetical protein VTL71DRAFT_3778 [Oculimacula yallundae]|uniref:Uncharacterized protein n=1 Tax=Oculimacula yallundae TaxID=86028 RepID=A0ABR4C575_9HELO
MASPLTYLMIGLLSLAKSVFCDISLFEGKSYYITSNVNPRFSTNLVGYRSTDGLATWPGINKVKDGSPLYGKWRIISVGDGGSYQLSNRAGFFLDITGGTPSAPVDPKPFLSTINDTSLDSQAGWVFIKANETDLESQDLGYWAAIVNRSWKLALRAPVMPLGSEYERVELGPIPTAWDSARYWFFASVTRATVWETVTSTGVTTSTAASITQIVDPNGPTSTITSTVVIQTFTAIFLVTSTAPPLARRVLVPRFDYQTATSTKTKTYWQTITVNGGVVKVTSQGGFVYETKLVSTSLYMTSTSTILVEQIQQTSLPTMSVLDGMSPPSTSTSADSAANTSDSNPQQSGGTPIAAIVGGVLGGVLLIVTLVATWLYHKHRQSNAAASRDSVPIYAAVATNPAFGSPGTLYEVGGGQAKTANTSAMTIPEVVDRRGSQIVTTGDVGVTDAARYELGTEANMVNGSRDEMPGPTFGDLDDVICDKQDADSVGSMSFAAEQGVRPFKRE